MTELVAAAERMARAVERLEAAARQRRAVATEVPVSRDGDRAERDQLGAELKRARSELAQLETVTDGVSLRLDTAIERLKAALDG
jgi:hypothetical protein